MNLTNPAPANSAVTVVHRSVPGPWSSNPRDRQVFRRILDLLALGHRVNVLAVEPHLPGGAPRALTEAGARLASGPRAAATRRVAHLTEQTACWYLTDAAPTRALLEALEASQRPLVLDVEHLRSEELRLGASALRPSEAAGIATELEHVVAFEQQMLRLASLVLCADRHTADVVATVLDDGSESTPTSTDHPTIRVVPATLDSGVAAENDHVRDTPPTLVLPGRFSDEFATPDESVARRVIADGWAARHRFSIIGEDTVPLLRRGFADSFDVVPRSAAWATTLGATAVLDVRTHGIATVSRRGELAAAGVPFVASRVALGNAELPGNAAQLVSDEPDEQLQLMLRLGADRAWRRAITADLRDLAAAGHPLITRALLDDVFDDLGIAPAAIAAGASASAVTSTGAAPDASVAPMDAGGEYRCTPDGGTLAAADPRIAQLEAEMVPLRLHDRDTSINLQSTMDADQRYRVFARTHLDAGPGAAPPVTETSAAIRFSILVPTWNSDVELLTECVRSVQAQQHSNWELCVVDDGSTSTDHVELLRRWSTEDERIKLVENPWNQGIALATNDALRMGSGDWVVLLDHDDALKPDALAWVAAYIDRCDDYDVWYSDEDKLSLDGRLVMPFFKPDWSPELLTGVNYVCHLLCVRRELMERVGGFRSGFDGAQDFDLVLRLTEQARRVGHIAKPLYSWRMVEGSTSLDTGAKPKAHHAGHQALTDALHRRFEPGVVEDGAADTTHVIRYSVDTEQLLTIMIPTRDRVDLLRGCIDRLERATGGVRYELLIVDNQSTDPDTLRYLERLVEAGHQVVRYPHEFSFARQIDLGALHARGDLLLILNNDALARNDDWLLRMMEHAQRPEVGLVGARLMFPEGQRDGRPQHEGIVMGMAGLAYNIDLGGYMGLDQFVRNCSSVTAACVMLRTSVLRAVAGMEERLRVAYNDVDFGLRISEMGYRVVYTPHALLEHPESASRGSLHPTEDEEWLISRWGLKGELREPFVNPHFEWLMPVFYRL